MSPDLPASAGEQVQSIAGTGFVIVDRTGMAVSCELTNYYPFGTGRIAPETGIVPAAAPTNEGRNPLSLGPMVAINGNTLKFRYAAAASGGPFAQATLTRVTAETLLAGTPLEQAMALDRVLGVDAPNVTVVESGAPPLESGLDGRGHNTQVVPWPGRGAALHCPSGLPRSDEPSVCAIANDPRGDGLGTMREPGS